MSLCKGRIQWTNAVHVHDLKWELYTCNRRDRNMISLHWSRSQLTKLVLIVSNISTDLDGFRLLSQPIDLLGFSKTGWWATFTGRTSWNTSYR